MKKIPEKLWKRLQSFHTKDEYNIILNSLKNKQKNVTFRINTLLGDEKEIEDVLRKNNIGFEKIQNIPFSYKLKEGKERILWDLDIYKEGKIYLQSLSSQIPVLFLGLIPGIKVLDITAAPGSKTSQIAAMLKNTGEIIANDNNAIRIEKLRYTLTKQGVKNTSIIKMDARNIHQKYKEETFDCILADLPCSAEGRIDEKNEKSFGFWSEENIAKNASLQKEILCQNIGLLKKGGTLVYSTCTLAPEENEEVITFVLEKFPELSLESIDIDLPDTKKGILSFGEKSFHPEIQKTLRCLPSEIFEGFYVAKLKKHS